MPGLSDIDVVAVAPEQRGAELLRQRRACLHARAPWGARPVTVAVYDEESLAGTVAGSCLTHGFDVRPAAPPAWSLRRSPRASGDSMGLRLRPKVPPAPSNWRLLAGRDRRPPAPVPTGQERRLVAWLELQYWWRRAFAACCRPHALGTPYLCVKLITGAGPYLALGDRGPGHHVPRRGPRARATRAARARRPAPSSPSGWARSLRRLRPAAGGGRRVPHPGQPTPGAHVCRRDREAGVTEVRLRGAEPAGSRRPLVDWRAALHRPLRRSGSSTAGLASRPVTLAEAARAARTARSRRSSALSCWCSRPTTRSRRSFRLCSVRKRTPCPSPSDGRASASFPERRRMVGRGLRTAGGRGAHRVARRSLLGAAADWCSRTILPSAARAALYSPEPLRRDPELIVTAAAVAEALDLPAAGIPELHARIASLPAFAAQRARLDRVASPLA